MYAEVSSKNLISPFFIFVSPIFDFILQTPDFRTRIPWFRIKTKKFFAKTLAISFFLLTFATIPQRMGFRLRESH